MRDIYLDGTWREPIIVVGAPRSGTKMLRELLKLHPKISGAQYEKERIWCYGNRGRMNASIGPEMLTPEIEKFIWQHFRRECIKSGGKWIVDKNVANTLRLEFIREIFPNSPIIHIVRDGRDAACSAVQRWQKPADFKYIIKNRAFPLEELPFFIKRQINFKLEKMLTGKKHVKWWGPRFDDSDALVQKYSLLELCGIQWARCVEAVTTELGNLDANSYTIKYEAIIHSPAEEMTKVFEFLELSSNDELTKQVDSYVQRSSVGAWKKVLSNAEYKVLFPHIQRILRLTGYVEDDAI